MVYMLGKVHNMDPGPFNRSIKIWTRSMPPEGIEIVQRSHLRENSGSMEFAETKEVSRRSLRELRFVRYIIRLEDLTKLFK